MNIRIVEAKLVIRCDVSLNNEIKQRLLNGGNKPLTEEEIANQLLYAFLNPKIEAFNEDQRLISGSWDFVCDFDGKLQNFVLDEE
ncbi:hypothetical protein P4388_10245 [Bacillus thuringiensis]|uniref:hypothetical protein n=1 Tax=Bacillus thuringiensis TaxID=1428 RepID=UPI000A3A9706|nr:hypothetical protein [Bacillus thuringiensis]MED3349009.1 hypothetical protein [Bacillus thuringiensis]MRB11102.1 hypothetical protein [Bacillus thuringiensis]OTW91706.1 hypothetical protein BK711_28240 [Bacillus thuringiensis serovar fukuokaensis]